MAASHQLCPSTLTSPLQYRLSSKTYSRAIFLDDVEHVFDRAGLADFVRDDGITRNRSAMKLLGRVRRVAANLLRVSGHLRGAGPADERDRAFQRSSDVI